MSEPTARAGRLQPVREGVLHWTVLDDRIQHRSEAYAVESSEGVVLVDPLPLEQSLLERLGRVAAICLTAGSHQRSAWRYRRLLEVPVLAPEGARGLIEVPDRVYRPGDLLPGGLRPLPTPGPIGPHHALLLERPGFPGVVFCGDLVIRGDNGEPFRFLRPPHVEDPRRAEESVRRLLALSFEALCPAHGAPLASGGRRALENLLAEQAAGRPEPPAGGITH
jgi:glyoxylase-like metal-dependent hydrolase (beta-lactamase superfamily II)